MHAHQLSYFFFSIFTSVVVYSRTTRTIKQTKQKMCYRFAHYVLFVRVFDYFSNFYINSAAKEKNAEHTRMYTIFRNSLHQYSRQLLSILAQLENKQKKTKKKNGLKGEPFWFCLLNTLIYLITCTVVQHKKIRSTHTHVHHLSQLSCQYSRRLLSILAQFSSQHNKHFVVIFNDITKKRSLHSFNYKYTLSTNFFAKRSSIFAKKCWSCFHTLRVGVFR